MELTLPTNWDDTLIENLAGLSGLNFYAKLAEDVVGGCREARHLPAVSRDSALAHIRLIHSKSAE